MTRTAVGIFVGGQSRRMGFPKGQLKAPGSRWTVLERLLSVTRAALPSAPVLLLGTNSAYDGVATEQLPDAAPGLGPIGGLLALSRWARVRRYASTLALACDMPYVTSDLIARLASACPCQPNLAARVDGRWQPFFARYEPLSTTAVVESLIGQQRLGMSNVLDTLFARPLPLSPSEASRLGDWDAPEDIRA